MSYRKSCMDPGSLDFVPSLLTDSNRVPKASLRMNRRCYGPEATSKPPPAAASGSVRAARGSGSVGPTINSQQPSTSKRFTPPNYQEFPSSVQRCIIKVEPVPEETATQEPPQIKEEQEDHYISPHVEAGAFGHAELRLPKSEPDAEGELRLPKSEPDSEAETSDNAERRLFKSEPDTDDDDDDSADDAELRLPKSEPDSEDDTSDSAEFRHPKSEPTTDQELPPSPPGVTVSVNDSDGSLSPPPSSSAELEQPPREEKSCRFCGKRFVKDSHLIRHVDKSHNGHKAFQCKSCSREFQQRYQLILHVRIHTGEKPFSCNFCGKTFTQNSSCVVHMRMHTGEKPYHCEKCGQDFPTGKHFKVCQMQRDENQKVEKPYKCFECDRQFKQRHQLTVHKRVHTGEKPYSCDFCGKTFTRNFSRVVHMRQHTGEKPYFCNKCGKTFAIKSHLKYCKGERTKAARRAYRCSTCARSFPTEENLEVHRLIHRSAK